MLGPTYPSCFSILHCTVLFSLAVLPSNKAHYIIVVVQATTITTIIIIITVIMLIMITGQREISFSFILC